MANVPDIKNLEKSELKRPARLSSSARASDDFVFLEDTQGPEVPQKRRRTNDSETSDVSKGSSTSDLSFDIVLDSDSVCTCQFVHHFDTCHL